MRCAAVAADPSGARRTDAAWDVDKVFVKVRVEDKALVMGKVAGRDVAKDKVRTSANDAVLAWAKAVGRGVDGVGDGAGAWTGSGMGSPTRSQPRPQLPVGSWRRLRAAIDPDRRGV